MCSRCFHGNESKSSPIQASIKGKGLSLLGKKWSWRVGSVVEILLWGLDNEALVWIYCSLRCWIFMSYCLRSSAGPAIRGLFYTTSGGGPF